MLFIQLLQVWRDLCDFYQDEKYVIYVIDTLIENNDVQGVGDGRRLRLLW